MHPVETYLRELKAPAGQNSIAVLPKSLLSTERVAKMMGSHRKRMGYEEMWVTGLNALFAVLVFAGALSCDESTVVDEPVAMELAVNAGTSDSVMATIVIANNGQEAIKLYYWRTRSTMGPAIGSYLTFDITLNGEKKFEGLGYVPMPMLPLKGDHLVLKNSDSYQETFALNTLYVSDMQRSSKSLSWPPGDYRIVCRYEYPGNSVYSEEAGLWVGAIVANPVEFTIEQVVE